MAKIYDEDKHSNASGAERLDDILRGSITFERRNLMKPARKNILNFYSNFGEQFSFLF